MSYKSNENKDSNQNSASMSFYFNGKFDSHSIYLLNCNSEDSRKYSGVSDYSNCMNTKSTSMVTSVMNSPSTSTSSNQSGLFVGPFAPFTVHRF
jgi:hypothetical protein